jgi:hypothetical protein
MNEKFGIFIVQYMHEPQNQYVSRKLQEEKDDIVL